VTVCKTVERKQLVKDTHIYNSKNQLFQIGNAKLIEREVLKLNEICGN